MSFELDRRSIFLGALIALVVLASALWAVAPKASAGLLEKSDCPAGFICVWEGPTFGGNRAFFSGSETGCHSLANIDPKSAYNHTGNHTAILVGLTSIGPGGTVSDITPAFTGELCIS